MSQDSTSFTSIDRIAVVNELTAGLDGAELRARRMVFQATISRLVAAGFFQRTGQDSMLKFTSMRAPLPWDAFLRQKRGRAVAHMRPGLCKSTGYYRRPKARRPTLVCAISGATSHRECAD